MYSSFNITVQKIYGVKKEIRLAPLLTTACVLQKTIHVVSSSVKSPEATPKMTIPGWYAPYLHTLYVVQPMHLSTL